MPEQLTLFGEGPVNPEEEARRLRSLRGKGLREELDICGVPVSPRLLSPTDQLLNETRNDASTVILTVSGDAAPQTLTTREEVRNVDMQKVSELFERMSGVEWVSGALKGVFFADDPSINSIRFQQLRPFCTQLLAATGGDDDQAVAALQDLQQLKRFFDQGVLSVSDFQRAVEAGLSPEHLLGNWTENGYHEHMVRLANGMLKQWSSLESYWRKWIRFSPPPASWVHILPPKGRRVASRSRSTRYSHPRQNAAQRDFVAKVVSYWEMNLLKLEDIEQLPGSLLIAIKRGMTNRVQPAEPQYDGKTQSVGSE